MRSSRYGAAWLSPRPTVPADPLVPATVRSLSWLSLRPFLGETGDWIIECASGDELIARVGDIAERGA